MLTDDEILKNAADKAERNDIIGNIEMFAQRIIYQKILSDRNQRLPLPFEQWVKEKHHA